MREFIDAWGCERPYEEIIYIIRVRKIGKHEVVEEVPLYKAVGFAHERVDRIINAART